MTPGFLDSKPRLLPLKRIAPSVFFVMSQCPLRGAWSSSRQNELLPSPPAVRLGTVIHSLLARAGAGAFVGIEVEAIQNQWQELIERTEQGMRDNWLERHLVPLRSSVQNFEVRRIRACNSAVQISSALPKSWSGSISRLASTGNEVWVQSEDGLVGGYVDRVFITDEGAVIQDYKSGSIFDLENSLHSGVIRESYALQMKLYAALYAASTGHWPIRLELIPLQGDVVQVPLDRLACQRLIEEAKALINEINSLITSLPASPTGIEERLARPSPSICANCPFRPVCHPYYEARRLSSDSESWPEDIQGIVHEIRQLGNMKFLLSIRPDGNGELLRHIRGLNPSPERHPAIPLMSPGNRVGLFNLQSSGDNGTFVEASLTTIYRFS